MWGDTWHHYVLQRGLVPCGSVQLSKIEFNFWGQASEQQRKALYYIEKTQRWFDTEVSSPWGDAPKKPCGPESRWRPVGCRCMSKVDTTIVLRAKSWYWNKLYFIRSKLDSYINLLKYKKTNVINMNNGGVNTRGIYTHLFIYFFKPLDY